MLECFLAGGGILLRFGSGLFDVAFLRVFFLIEMVIQVSKLLMAGELRKILEHVADDVPISVSLDVSRNGETEDEAVKRVYSGEYFCPQFERTGGRGDMVELILMFSGEANFPIHERSDKDIVDRAIFLRQQSEKGA